ncbi:MAG: DUF456 domain-containing protein [Myxococcales bacterium]|nr:MAG: DUF456 domain-containing protein [Myxococcales bacterium]
MIIAIVIAIALVGIIVPVLPGDWLIAIAVLVWASETGGRTAWTWAGVALGLLVVGFVLQYAVPGRRLKRDGIATSTLVVAGVLGIIGFFVIPVIGLPIGFVAGVYLMQWRSKGREHAWPATVKALKAVGQAILIEFCFALLATGAWVAGVIAT